MNRLGRNLTCLLSSIGNQHIRINDHSLGMSANRTTDAIDGHPRFINLEQISMFTVKLTGSTVPIK
ncbi:MAG: hypothetical protein PHZ03_04540 [Syntrophomonas sp.]|nr:hypothetical protein [Syntrophomonas sp.]